MASVIVVNKTSSREISLTNAVTVVGRDGGVGLELGDLQVSRRHALLVSASEGYFVKDLGSRNGVLLNQQRLPSRRQAPLRNGDVLSVGRTTLVFKDLGLGAPIADPVQTVRNALPATQVPGPVDQAAEAAEAAQAAAVEAAEAAAVRPAPARKRPSSSDPSIPRAMAPGAGAPVYSGQAEVLALRALIERGERDRIFYRNLALILFAALALTAVVVIAWALFRKTPEAPIADRGATSVESAGPAPLAARIELDAQAFADHVQPILSARCATCHEYVGRGGDLLLAKSSDPATVEANMAAVTRFVIPGRPESSPLLLKPVDPDEGGQPHDGGTILEMDSAEWLAIRDWVSGTSGSAALPAAPDAAPVTPGDPNAPPTARIAAPELARVGEQVPLSAKASTDPQGDPLSFRWTLIESPQGATATVVNATETSTTFTPDVAGRYVIALVVRDPLSATGSAEHTLTVEPPAPDLSRTEQVADAFKALLGRAPTRPELEAALALKGRALQTSFLERDDLYHRWWDSELHHLGLTGAYRPQGEPWDGLPGRLKAGKYSVQDAFYALLVGQSWSARYAGREPYVTAVLGKLLGHEKSLDPALREAALRLYDGHESTLLGKRTKGQVGLVRVAVRHAEAKRHLLERTHRAVLGTPAPAKALDAAVSRLTAEPRAFFEIVVGWACRGL